MTAPRPSPEEAAIIDRFGMFADESAVERVARAVTEARMYIYADRGWDDLDEDERDVFRTYARAAVAAMPAPDALLAADLDHVTVERDRAEAALRRVEAVAEELDAKARVLAEEADDVTISEKRRHGMLGRILGMKAAAQRIRAALRPAVVAREGGRCGETLSGWVMWP